MSSNKYYYSLLLISILFFTLYLIHNIRVVEQRLSQEVSWVGEEEERRLMRYHGVDRLKITPNEVKIEREGKWITVERREDR